MVMQSLTTKFKLPVALVAGTYGCFDKMNCVHLFECPTKSANCTQNLLGTAVHAFSANTNSRE